MFFSCLQACRWKENRWSSCAGGRGTRANGERMAATPARLVSPNLFTFLKSALSSRKDWMPVFKNCSTLWFTRIPVHFGTAL